MVCCQLPCHVPILDNYALLEFCSGGRQLCFVSSGFVLPLLDWIWIQHGLAVLMRAHYQHNNAACC